MRIYCTYTSGYKYTCRLFAFDNLINSFHLETERTSIKVRAAFFLLAPCMGHLQRGIALIMTTENDQVLRVRNKEIRQVCIIANHPSYTNQTIVLVMY